MADAGNPRVLVLGGTGFIGRNLVHYLVSNGLASKVRVADKVPPQMAWFSEVHKESFSSPTVEFNHSNLINPVSVENAFTDPDGPFDYVINLAAETKYGQTDPVYREGIVRLSLNCAHEAAKKKVQLYMELSSGQMHSTDKDDIDPKPIKEETKCDPWTQIAMHKLEVERELKNIDDLNYIVVRPAIVYGIGDRSGLTPRLIIGAIYKYIKEKMKMLWTKDMKMNTVHVDDLCRAIWHLCLNGRRGQIYHVVDKGNTTQGVISELVADIYAIQYDFVGSVFSSLAKFSMSSVVEDINDKHVSPWAEACQRDGIDNTPLNPFIDQELLYRKHLYMDGSKLEEMGFVYEKPKVCIDVLREVLEDYLKLGLFPQSLLSAECLWNGRNDENEEEDNDPLE